MKGLMGFIIVAQFCIILLEFLIGLNQSEPKEWVNPEHTVRCELYDENLSCFEIKN